jgi:hypothetical protein
MESRYCGFKAVVEFGGRTTTKFLVYLFELLIMRTVLVSRQCFLTCASVSISNVAVFLLGAF